jgi:hypothetical protein
VGDSRPRTQREAFSLMNQEVGRGSACYIGRRRSREPQYWPIVQTTITSNNGSEALKTLDGKKHEWEDRVCTARQRIGTAILLSLPPRPWAQFDGEIKRCSQYRCVRGQRLYYGEKGESIRSYQQAQWRSTQLQKYNHVFSTLNKQQAVAQRPMIHGQFPARAAICWGL